MKAGSIEQIREHFKLVVRSGEYAWVAGMTFTGPCAWSMAHNYILANGWKYEVLHV